MSSVSHGKRSTGSDRQPKCPGSNKSDRAAPEAGNNGGKMSWTGKK